MVCGCDGCFRAVKCVLDPKENEGSVRAMGAAGTDPAGPLKNGLSRHPLAFSGGICENKTGTVPG